MSCKTSAARHRTILANVMQIRPFALSVLLLLSSPGRSETPFPSEEETRAEFEALCQRLVQSDNHYFGRALVDDLQERLKDPVTDPQVSVLLRGRLAHELIRLGKHREAIDAIREAQNIAREAQRHGVDFLARSPELEKALAHLLGAAHMQIAEDENCIGLHTAASCILPLDRSAVHRRPRHARLAGDVYAEWLQRAPDDLQARWLLNLARIVSGDYPEAVPESFRLPEGSLSSEAPFRRWVDIATPLGVAAYDLAGGAAMDDFDGDGLLDIITSTWDPCGAMKAFRNRGNGEFEDVSVAWGMTGQLGGLNLVQADFDNDGMLDLLILRGAWLGVDGRMRNSLLRNDLKRGARRFVDVTAAAGMAFPAYPTQAGAWADYDGDGDLDLYVGNEATAVAVDPLQLFGRTGNSYPSQLFRNNGDGTFTDVARAAGVANTRYAKAAAWGDYDNDGDPDLYVSNIGPNRLYRNNGDGTFAEVTEALGVREPSRGSFATWFFDYDNDGDLDLFVADYDVPVVAVSASYLGMPTRTGHPVIYRNDGNGFVDVSRDLGLDRPALPMGANYGDLDNDGWLDVYLGTGVPDYDALMPNIMYRNDGGSRFIDITFAGGFGHLQKGHAVAFGDLDNDGDQDLLEQVGGAYPYDAYSNVLFENPGDQGSWIVLRLIGTRANRFGVGARIEAVVATPTVRRSVYALAGTGGSFGGSSLQQEIGLGGAHKIERLVIQWPGSGTRQEFDRVERNRFYEVREDRAELKALALPRIELQKQVPADQHAHTHPGGATR